MCSAADDSASAKRTSMIASFAMMIPVALAVLTTGVVRCTIADMRRLPPLTAIEAFVQVARLGSIKAAAEELALSSPALSRRVQSLERFIGKPLFERRHQALRLNADGERLLAGIAPPIDAMSDAVEAMMSGVELLRLRLGVLPLFATQRLLPRMGELKRPPSRTPPRCRYGRAWHDPAGRRAGRRDRAGARGRSDAVCPTAGSQPRLCDRREKPSRGAEPGGQARATGRADRIAAPRHAGKPSSSGGARRACPNWSRWRSITSIRDR